MKWYWQSFFHSRRSSARVPSSGHTWPRLTRSLPSVSRCMMFSCRVAGRSVSVIPVDAGWRRGVGEEAEMVTAVTETLASKSSYDGTCNVDTCSLCWSGCCPTAAATAGCSPCGGPRCLCSPPEPTCPCPERDHTARHTASAIAPWWGGRSAGRRELREQSIPAREWIFTEGLQIFGRVNEKLQCAASDKNSLF